MATRSTQAARQSQELREAERAERELNDDVNEAIARTDSEVFTEALGDEPIGEDTDTSLEQMGEGLEGDELEDEEAEQPEGDETSEQQQQPVEGEDGEVRQPLRTEGQEQSRQQEQQPQQPSIPPRVLRETRERFRENESVLQRQIDDLREHNRQLMALAQQPRQQPQPQRQEPQRPETKPDMYTDPEGHEQWVERRAEERAEARINERLAAFEQRQRQEQMQRLDAGLSVAAQGPRAYEFNVAYRDLMSLDKTPENAALVRRLTAQPDNAGNAILDWWERSSNPEYVQYHRDQVARAYGGYAGDGERQRGFNGGNRGGRQTQPQPRHEVRLPPSLNEASGGRSQHTIDPAMFDSSESSVFDYGSRK